MPPEVRKPHPVLGISSTSGLTQEQKGLPDGQRIRRCDYFRHFTFVMLHSKFLSCVCHEVKSPGELI